MGLCKEHDHLYFDKLCRTKKQETVLALIEATHQAKLNNGTKQDIARLLENAYELYKFDSGTYSGDVDAFSSQYTIGHEVGIWNDSDLDLSPLAVKVANKDITIREYFDIVFLNYIQPIDGIVYNLMYLITKYASDNNKELITKDDLKSIFSFAGNKDANEINGLFNMVIATSYFSQNDSNTLKLEYNASDIEKCCNTTYHKEKYEKVKEELGDNLKFIQYLQTDHRIFEITYSYKMINGLNEKSILSKADDSKIFKLDGCSDRTDYSLEELGKILNNMYSTYKKQTTAIHLFGIKYGKSIRENNYTGVELAKVGGISESYHVEISKGVRIYDAIENKEFGLSFETIKPLNLETDKARVGYNKIFYGIPGSGKSYYVENVVLKSADKNKDVFRTTFYLDYSNSDFVGQIMPVVKGDNVSYEYIPGPFTKALERALTNKDINVYLVIEELNRGNAAAIFGDLFQLLDRIKEDDVQHRTSGESEYPITNNFIESYFEKCNTEGIINERNEGKYIEYQKGKIVIPSNLIILATMNTSDQNVFPLDSAFKRRWKSELVKPNWDKYQDADELMVPFSDKSWKEFAETINNEMLVQSKNGVIMEDKQLGPWFADRDMLVSRDDNNKAIEYLKELESSRTPEEKELIENNIEVAKSFVYKIMDYIWSDVSKYYRDEWFEEDCKSLSHIIDKIDQIASDSTDKGEYLCLKVFDKNDKK